MNIKKAVLGLFLLSFFFFAKADASKLPDDVWKYVKANIPEANQRFDSVITLKNGIMYIPLYPPTTTEVEKIQIDYTYPAGMTFKQQPEVILLNNGYSFLKVFKDTQGNYSLTKKDDLPIKVRLGLMPQDMLTPIGLKMPESLKLTLGDLLIPSKDENALAKLDDDQKSTFSPTVKRDELIPSVEFKNKKIFINPKNSKFLEVFDNTTPNPLYELKLSAMPFKMIKSASEDTALVLYWNSKEADIINLKDENTIAKIKIDHAVSDAVLNAKDNLIYVACAENASIYVINMNSAQLAKVIKLDQRPSKIAYSEVDNSIVFYDEYMSKVFIINEVSGDYIVKLAGEVKNLSAIITDVANVYAISRTESNMKIFDKNQDKLIATIDLDKKPTEAYINGTKIFIICSKEGYLDVYDIVKSTVIAREQLPKNDFYSKITLIPDSQNIVITGLNAKNYLIYDTNSMKLIKKQDSYINISNIVIMNKP